MFDVHIYSQHHPLSEITSEIKIMIAQSGLLYAHEAAKALVFQQHRNVLKIRHPVEGNPVVSGAPRQNFRKDR